MREIIEMLTNFIDDRPVIKVNNTFERLIQYAEEETDELFAAIHNGNTEDEIASEVADGIIFLLNASSSSFM